ncbi:MAG: TolA-binding protein [Planctomycetota bacterium]|jgi:TolA-binding protein
MRALRTNLILPFLGTLLFAAVAQADTIYKTDGDAIEDVKVTKEALDLVTYRAEGSRKEATIASDSVLRVEFSKKPELVDSADGAALTDAYFPAINDFESFLADAGGKAPKGFAWSINYSLYRLVQMNMVVGELDKAVVAADRFLTEAPESRYVPLVYLAKARALFDSGKGSDAGAAVGQLMAMSDSGKVGARWGLEAEVHAVIFKGGKGTADIAKYKSLATKAAKDFPIVASRARIAAAEALMSDKKVADAEKLCREVIKSGQGDARTLAGAYKTLGDCLYQRASGDGKLLNDAVLAYMRVVVVYEKEFAYSPHSMLYAGLAFRALGGDGNEERAQKMFTTVRRRFPGTRYADEAKSLRKR